MPEERKAASRHKLIIDQRESASVSGVLDVISFDEEVIMAETERGVIILKGSGLHVNNLNLDNGQLDIDGEIVSAAYEDTGGIGKKKSSLLEKLFK